MEKLQGEKRKRQLQCSLLLRENNAILEQTAKCQDEEGTAGFREISTKSVTYLSSFMAMSKGSVSPSSSTITGAHILGKTSTAT